MVTNRDRVFQISTNRGSATHRVRYVESSAPAEGECRLCVGNLSDREHVSTTNTQTGDEIKDKQKASDR
ncbi:MAG: hypothetical protein HLUCCO02_04600 [Idiomarinaceae bacterium HL-53]|nr:MAG: hypothetical protein HLUCCO02_04600 [Idiomarinaceae bacterium HL-53]CUS49296.1 hypothetical protein Ga0003345_2284 [Idiomarinaceae bacterium HL-53]